LEALIALSGVVAGWVLASLSEVVRSRRSARQATALVLYELHNNFQIVASIAKGYHLEDAPLSEEAWRAYGFRALELADGPTLQRLTDTYFLVRLTNATIQLYAEVRQLASEERRKTLPEVIREPLANAKEAIAVTIVDMSLLASMTTFDLVFLRLGRYRVRRREAKRQESLSRTTDR
jgi:hypothetical protein